jgi:hypothetical protein
MTPKIRTKNLNPEVPYLLHNCLPVYASLFSLFFTHVARHKKGNKSHVIARSVSRRLPTSEARLRSKIRSCGNCGENGGTGSDFFGVLRFALPVIPPTAPIFISNLSLTLDKWSVDTGNAAWYLTLGHTAIYLQNYPSSIASRPCQSSCRKSGPQNETCRRTRPLR